MVRIGYVRLEDHTSAAMALKAHGCHVVRAEEPGDAFAVLEAILDFMGIGDQLVIERLDQLSPTSRGVLDVIDRLDARGASLHILRPELSSCGESGRALRAALEAVAAVEPAAPVRRGAAATHQIRDLQRAGLGPVEIARRLGVSRMTVWRKLRAVEA